MSPLCHNGCVGCACGCGQATAISTVSNAARGWIRGQPRLWVRGHWMRRAVRVERIECVCGCDGVIEWTYSSRTRRPRRLPGHVTPRLRAKYEAQRTSTEPNLSGFCQCGCGERTPISHWTNARTGVVKGKPTRFVLNHQLRGVKRGEGRYVNSQGYVMLRMPDHPQANKGYVLEHRWVMEQALERPLLPSEMVHHRNGIRDDNQPENLVILSRIEHGLRHGRPKGSPTSAEHRRKLSVAQSRVWAERHAARPS